MAETLAGRVARLGWLWRWLSVLRPGQARGRSTGPIRAILGLYSPIGSANAPLPALHSAAFAVPLFARRYALRHRHRPRSLVGGRTLARRGRARHPSPATASPAS